MRDRDGVPFCGWKAGKAVRGNQMNLRAPLHRCPALSQKAYIGCPGWVLRFRQLGVTIH